MDQTEIKKDCCNCRYGDYWEGAEPCFSCHSADKWEREIQTVFDRIHAMSVNEFADWCAKLSQAAKFGVSEDGDDWLAWLKQEAME